MAIHKMITGEYVTNELDVTVDYVKFNEPREQITYVGRVISVYQAGYQAMSDVYTTATFAEVMNDDCKIEHVLVNANFECDVSLGRAVVDAGPGVLAIKKSLELMAEGQRIEAQRQDEARRVEEEKNRPVKGKKMVVVRGRKVPVGTIGVVAYVKDGSALLKDEANWKDRNAHGTWINACYLKAV